jgi:tight adherence protein C
LAFVAVSLLVVIGVPTRLLSGAGRLNGYLLSPGSTLAARPIRGFLERVVLPALGALGELVNKATPAGMAQRVRQRLDMAGNPRSLGLAEYLGLRVLSPAVVIPLGLIGLTHVDLGWVVEGLALVLVIGVGMWLPDIVLQRIIEARHTAVQRTLPDAVDLMVVSVEAGMGLEGAMQRVAERSRGPLAEELRRALEQIRLGRSRSDALREMGQRTQVQDLMSFVAAVGQGETMGVSIAKVLRTQADAVRKRRSERARDTAAKLPVKLLFPLVFFIFPALFVVILGPAAIRFSALFKVLGK